MYGIELNRESEISIARQLYQALREQILAGRLREGEKLPSTRYLAEQLSVSRSTVCEAYEMLLAEGYILNRQGSPSRIANGLKIERMAINTEIKVRESKKQNISVDFRTGKPDLRCFPRNLWNKLLLNASSDMPLESLDYSSPDGLSRLREEIAGWLFRTKGMDVDHRNIFITSGATQALHILACLLFKKGKEILIEDPCHKGMYDALKSVNIPIKPVPVDEQGIMPENLYGSNAFAIYLTPSHQFPLGGILPAGRRSALVRFARENGLYIIEDDYDSEFRYSGEPISPIYSMDTHRVIYVGTFSKILFPALRIGYVILPPHLHKDWRYLKMHMDVQNPPFEQSALIEMLRTRKLDLHIKRMRKIYSTRRKVLLDSIGEKFGKEWRLYGDSAGLHLAVKFTGLVFDEDFMAKCREKGIYVTPVEYHSIIKGIHTDKLLLGYGHLEPEEIRKGISLLYEFFANYFNFYN